MADAPKLPTGAGRFLPAVSDKPIRASDAVTHKRWDGRRWVIVR